MKFCSELGEYWLNRCPWTSITKSVQPSNTLSMMPQSKCIYYIFEKKNKKKSPGLNLDTVLTSEIVFVGNWKKIMCWKIPVVWPFTSCQNIDWATEPGTPSLPTGQLFSTFLITWFSWPINDQINYINTLLLCYFL